MKICTPILQEYINNETFEFHSLFDEWGTLIIKLTGNRGTKLTISFGDYRVYRKMDEGDGLNILYEMSKSGPTNKCLYRVEESDFAQWYSEERHFPIEEGEYTHYLIGPANDIIDVISISPPQIIRE